MVKLIVEIEYIRSVFIYGKSKYRAVRTWLVASTATFFNIPG